jgi:hypothetical protein
MVNPFSKTTEHFQNTRNIITGYDRPIAVAGSVFR